MAEAVVAGRYQNLHKLGHGGMGEVFLAQDSLKSQPVALKFLHRHLGHQAQDLFREEVKLLSRLSHPNLVRIYDYLEGESSQGPCFAMEHVAGNTLDRVPTATDFSQWLTWFVQLAQGLHYLHRRGILHGDLKPSNLLVNSEQELKILDFGLAALLTRKEKHAALGTLAYMPPEAFWGEYDAQSDLFSMGVLFYELLGKRLPFQKPLTGNLEKLAAPPPLAELRPDLPIYFCDLVQRLIELKPERRPPSALALLKFVNQHADSPFEILDPEDSQIILSKTPLVGRHQEIQTFWKFLEASPAVSQVLILSGPTGVGRTRLLDDMKWQIQLKGGIFFNTGPETALSWRKIWREGLGLPEPAGKTDLLSELREIFSKIPKKNVTASFSDLHLWPSAALKELEIAVQLIPTLQAPVKIVLEFASDFPNESLRSLTNHLTSYLALELKDLPPEPSRDLVKQASVDAPLGEELTERIVTESGGRPLLLLEAVRHFIASPQSWAERDSIPLPKNLQEVTALRIQSLGAPAQVLLAALCAEPESRAADDVRQVTELNPEVFAAQLANLRQQGLLELRPGRSPLLELIHPSLRLAMLEALPDTLLKETHLRWLRHLEPRPQATETQATLPDPLALRLYRHAAGAGLVAELKKYGIQAAKALQSQDRLDEAIAVLHRLYQEASNAFERSFTQAHLAPVLYRAGRLQEAIRAYDLWFKDREDDASRLQKVKHCFYTGLALHTLHREDAALKRLQECLETGDSMQFPAHRPYHVQAHGLIASLHEKKGEGAAAREHLRQALAIAEGQPKLLGDIEQRWGRLEQRELNFAEARNHYRHALEHFIAEKNFQAQAIAHDLLGMLALECGELADARHAMRTALDLAQQGGDLPQWARYRVNEALVAMEMAQYGAAQEGLEEGRLLLSSLGNAHDQILTEIHRLSLYAATGNWDRSRQILNSLKGRLTEIGQLRELAQFFLAVAELAYCRGRIESAQAYFKAALEAPQISPSNRIFAELGLYRCAVRWGGAATLSLPPSEKTPSLQIYRAVSEFFLKPQDDEALRRALAEIKNCQRPEWRRDFYELLTRYFIGKNSERATRLRQATLIEFKNILEQLPEEQRMDYEKNREPKSLDDALDDLLPSAQNATQPEPSTKSGAGTAAHIPEARFRQFSEINRQIAQKNNLKEILERVMDAAIELTGAERGFLLLKKEGHPGTGLGAFDIKTARHINQGSLQEQEFKFSMTAVEQAIQQGASLLTDNAQLDPRFQERQSVVQYQLKSILAVPLEIEGQILGAIYLDHRYQPGCFKEEDVVLLNAFSSQAALAIQKAQMIEALKQAKDKLEIKVEDQAKQIESLHGELAMVREELKYEYKDIVGQSPSMMQVFQLLDHVTETTIPVWILGESGTGKELIAHALHNNSPRRNASFVSENCSAIPETLLESELFGHKKGAFTHADRDRVGLFEQANHGTLFLDEIADMPMSMQVKLLRVLQEGEVRPLGSNKKVKIDVRLVTASNRDLNQMVKAGSFRQDLFFRINGLNIKLPPLRERKDDIPLLVNHMIEKIARSFNLKASEVSDDAFQKLLRYSWPGNIRELEGVVRNALLFAKGRLITAEFLSIPEGKESQAAPLPPGMSRALPNEEESAERQFILDALKRHQLDKEKAAEELGISLRSLYTRMEKLNIPKKKTVLAKYLG